MGEAFLCGSSTNPQKRGENRNSKRKKLRKFGNCKAQKPKVKEEDDDDRVKTKKKTLVENKCKERFMEKERVL